ncbi:cation/H(+) antiporter 15 [Rosa sericea]
MSGISPALRANITAQVEKLGFALPYNNRTYTVVCYNLFVRKSSKQLQHLRLPTDLILPVFLVQMVSIMFVSSILVLALKRFHQPRIVAQILAGILLGPTLLGEILNRLHMFTSFAPFESVLSLETIGNLGLVYYMFLVGLELELKPVIRAGKKALSIALVGMVVAIASGWGLFFVLDDNIKPNLKFLKAPNQRDNTHSGHLFWALALGTTSFPDVARILADLKLLHSELGRLALSSAVISDLCSWFLFILLLALTNLTGHFFVAGLTTLAFVWFCVFVLRPALPKLIRFLTKNKEDKRDNYNELHVSFVLMGVLVCAMITDSLGTLSYVGAFVLGAIMPRGELSKLVVEKIQPFVTGIMMPLFFLIVGLRTNMWFVFSSHDSYTAFQFKYAKRFMLVLSLAFLPKIAGSFVAALIHKMKPWNALALGVVMNTRGLMALFILSTGRDLKTLDQKTFPAMIFVVWALMIPIGPFLAYSYKTTKHFGQYKNRNIRSIGSDTELRILACTHESRNSPAIINLLEASNPTRQSPIQVFAVQLVEMIGHTSAMLIVHDACKPNNEGSKHKAGQISPSLPSNPFELYAKERENVHVQALTIVSAYSTMHEDICNFAEDKCITLVIVPFHQQSTLDGTMEESNPALRAVNRNVIDNAPCSVGVLVDRGLGISQIFKSNISSHISSDDVSYHRFAVFFIGGVDDREALAYAKRMAGHSRVDLTVVRFILNTEACLDDADYDNEILEAMANTGRQKQLDDLYLDGFRVHTMHNSSIKLVEEVVNSWEETLDFINDIEGDYDLYIMGRRHGSSSTLAVTSELDSSDCDELGTLAEALVSSSFFKVNTSILIVQQGAAVEEIQDESDYQEM